MYSRQAGGLERDGGRSGADRNEAEHGPRGAGGVPTPFSKAYRSGGVTHTRCKVGSYGPAPSARSSRPDARSWRRLACLSCILPVLALLGGALAAAPTAADVLVSNIGQPGGSLRDFVGLSHAQGFTTGSHAKGYHLESIELQMTVTGSLTEAERKTIGAELRSAATGGRPGETLAILTVPSSVTTGAVAFKAPANTVLAADTSYYLVVYTFHYSLSKLKVAITGHNGEDSGAAEGWSIANNGRYLRLQHPYQRQNSPNRPRWQADTQKRQIRVNGIGVVPPKTLTLTTDAANGTAAEDVGAVTVTATLDQPATAAVSVALAAGAASTATATEDYALPSAFTIARGETAATADVTIVDDDVDEGDETLVLTASVSGLATTPATLTITDDDDAGVTVSDTALSVAAGCDGDLHGGAGYETRGGRDGDARQRHGGQRDGEFRCDVHAGHLGHGAANHRDRCEGRHVDRDARAHKQRRPVLQPERRPGDGDGDGGRARRANRAAGFGRQRPAGPVVDGAALRRWLGDHRLRCPLHLLGHGRRRRGRGHERGDGMGGAGPGYGERPADGLAGNHGPDQQHRLPGACAGEERRRQRRLGAWHRNAAADRHHGPGCADLRAGGRDHDGGSRGQT